MDLLDILGRTEIFALIWTKLAGVGRLSTLQLELELAADRVWSTATDDARARSLCHFGTAFIAMARNHIALRNVTLSREKITMHKSGQIKTSLSVAGHEDRIVLYYWSCSEEARFRNVARLNRGGDVIWRAELPGDHDRDCFVSLKANGSGFVATTHRGLTTHLLADGQVRKILSAEVG